VLARGFEALNMHTAPIPMAVLSEPYNGRLRVSGRCAMWMSIGALANPLQFISRVSEGGRADAWPTRPCHASDRQTALAIGVEYFTTNGDKVTQPASAVVLTAFTVENSRILLNSANAAHPHGAEQQRPRRTPI